MPLLPESASPGDTPLAEVFPQDLFLVLSNQDQLAPYASPPVPVFHLQLAIGPSAPTKNWKSPSQLKPVHPIAPGEAVFCIISECRSKGSDVFALALTSCR